MRTWTKAFLICFILSCLAPLDALAEKDPAVHFRQAEQAFEKYDFVQAEQFYRETLKQYPDTGNFTAYLNNQIALCLRYQKKTEEAVQVYRTLKEQYPESPAAAAAQENIARTYYEAEEYAKAGPEFEKLGDEIELEENGQEQVLGAGINLQVNEGTAGSNRKKTEAFSLAIYCFRNTKKGDAEIRNYQKWLKYHDK